jgi:Tfp pilus assembly protein PilF
MQCYNESLKLDPDFQQALLNRAALHVMNKNLGAARADLRQILLLNPQQEEVKRLLKSIN